VTAALLAGLLVGVGAWFAWTGLRPAPEPLSLVLQRIERRPSEALVEPDEEDVDRDTRIGRFMLRHFPLLARQVERVHADLRVVGRTPEEQAARVGAYGVVALWFGPWVGFVAVLFGIKLPLAVPGLLALVGAGLAMLGPFLVLKQEALERRRVFSHGLSAWCDVVVMSLASGRGVEQAMETAAAAGTGWTFNELRGALRSGYVRGEPPWVALGRLGDELAVPDLVELSNTIAMAGEEGAAVRVTVQAKARTIRERITSDVEVEAATATERMSLPSVLLVAGFFVFLSYPAVDLLLGSGL
jgi:tight adherence protein C